MGKPTHHPRSRVRAKQTTETDNQQDNPRTLDNEGGSKTQKNPSENNANQISHENTTDIVYFK